MPGVGPASAAVHVIPILFHMSVVANFPPRTPIEAVIVMESA